MRGYREFETDGLDVGRFREAWQRLVDRHDMLRMVVLGYGQQRVLEDVPAFEVRGLICAGWRRGWCRVSWRLYGRPCLIRCSLRTGGRCSRYVCVC